MPFLLRAAFLASLVSSALAADAHFAEACPLATDSSGNYSPVEHIRCLREAAEQGNILSRHRLGLSYFNGDETPQDYEAAAKWFHRSADQENPVSQFMLSSMYNQGRGVPKNIVTAHMWLILSSAEGVTYALKARELNEQEMSLAQVAEAQKLAREWKPKPER